MIIPVYNEMSLICGAIADVIAGLYVAGGFLLLASAVLLSVASVRKGAIGTQ